jgi:hypothetical protein
MSIKQVSAGQKFRQALADREVNSPLQIVRSNILNIWLTIQQKLLFVTVKRFSKNSRIY